MIQVAYTFSCWKHFLTYGSKRREASGFLMLCNRELKSQILIPFRSQRGASPSLRHLIAAALTELNAQTCRPSSSYSSVPGSLSVFARSTIEGSQWLRRWPPPNCQCMTVSDSAWIKVLRNYMTQKYQMWFHRQSASQTCSHLIFSPHTECWISFKYSNPTLYRNILEAH